MKVGFQKVPSNKLGWRWKISVQDSKMSLAWKAWGFEAGTLSWTDAQNWNPWHLLWCQAWINWIIKAHSWNRPEFGGFSICKRINGGTIWVWPKTSKSLEGKRTRNLNFVARPPFWGWTSGLPYSHLHKPQPSPPHDLRSAELLDCWEDEVGLIAAKCHGFEQPKFGDVANNDSAYDLIRAPCPGKKQINIHPSVVLKLNNPPHMWVMQNRSREICWTPAYPKNMSKFIPNSTSSLSGRATDSPFVRGELATRPPAPVKAARWKLGHFENQNAVWMF
jgi:hypothetical protein